MINLAKMKSEDLLQKKIEHQSVTKYPQTDNYILSKMSKPRPYPSYLSAFLLHQMQEKEHQAKFHIFVDNEQAKLFKKDSETYYKQMQLTYQLQKQKELDNAKIVHSQIEQNTL
jgi:hypothetical protein